MAISNYQDESGETLWKVYVNVRSNLYPNLRVQRKLKGVKTEKEAAREETKLLRECEREIMEKESLGSSWGAVVEAWGHFIEHDASQLSLTTKLDYVAAVKNYSASWNNQAAASITRHAVRELLLDMKNRGCSFGFQKRMKGLLNQVFTFGIENNLIRDIDRSPTFGVKLDRQEQKRPEILLQSTIERLSHSNRVIFPVYILPI